MRITQGHLFAHALQDINRGLLGYTAKQTQVATGRRINRASDDPAAALRIIPLLNDQRHLAQLADNVALARETLDTGAAALEDASSLMQRLRELTMQAANDTTDPSDRASIGGELDQLLHQLVGIGNSQHGDRYLFGGTGTSEPPFELVDDAGGSRVVYHGNHDQLEVEVAPGLTTALNAAGDGIFQHRERSGVTFTGDTGAAPTGGGDTGTGFQTLTVTCSGVFKDAPPTVAIGSGTSNAVGQLAYVFTAAPPTLSIGGGPAVSIPATDADFTTSDGRVLNLTVSGVPATLTGTFTAKAGLSTDGGHTVTEVDDFTRNSVAVHNGYDGSVLNVDARQLARTGQELVKHAGTFDAFTVLITLRDLLQNRQGLPSATVRDRAAQMLAEIPRATDAVLDGLREQGFRSSSMQMLGNRVAGLQLATAQSLSTIQDTDMPAAILDLQRQDINYQAALQVAARVVQTSLQNFLR